MYAPRAWVDELGQGVDVGAQQFLQSPVLQYLAHYLVPASQAFQHFLRGDVLSGLRLLGLGVNLEAVEEHFAHLAGRGDVEHFAGQAVDVLFDVAEAVGEVCRCLAQGFGVYAHAVALQVDEHGHQGHLHVAQQGLGARLFKFLVQHVPEAEGDVGILAGVAVDVGGREVGHGLLAPALVAQQFFDVDGAVVQVDFGQVVHVVAQLGLEDVVGQHGVEQRTPDLHAVVLQHNHVVLDVLPHLQGLRVFVEWTQGLHDAPGFRAVGGYGDVPRFARSRAEAHAHHSSFLSISCLFSSVSASW